jgi:hypothetical protein
VSAGAAVRTRLLEDATVATLVGTRIYPGRLPQSPTLPAVVYNEISPGQFMCNDSGLSRSSRPRIQLDVYAATYAAAHDLVEKIDARLAGIGGPAGSDSIDAALPDGGLGDDDSEQPPLPDGSRPFRVSRDFVVFHTKE